MKVKICGITRQEDASAARDADFLGFVFVKESPRYVTAEQAASIESDGPKRVGVFRNLERETIARIAEQARLDFIQLHGEEPDADYCRPVIRAIRVSGVAPSMEEAPSAQWLLFDSGGGSGRTFQWSLLAGAKRTRPFFVAGGITPENVEDAIAIAKPDGIDVSTGVESAPGIKDAMKIRRLIEKVKR